MLRSMELGLCTFGELTPDPITGRTRFRDLVEEIALADQLGLDVFGVDVAVSAPAVVLAAAAERTSRIRLQGAVTVNGAADPLAVLRQFATLDQLSHGRAEIVAEPGPFIESLAPSGDAPLDGQSSSQPVWVAVDSTPESAVRAGMLGLPMAIAITGGAPERFVPLVDLFRRTARASGHVPAPAVSIHCRGYVTETSRGPEGAAFIGSPTGVAERLLGLHERFGHDRFLLQVPAGLAHAQVMRSIELFGTEVAPVVGRALELEAAAPA
jgi:alkanesulfonate monooxygenase SsuD/methylene tetrahydromethanopterin reductase-like flavin-dependent oxidoreductase (luciferase family)